VWLCRPEQSVAEECFEFFLLIAMASEQGINKFYEPKIIDALASSISTLPDGMHSGNFCTIILLAFLYSKLR
jgi:hypothetical protein